MTERFVTYRGILIPLKLDERGLWTDCSGCVYGFREDTSSVDARDVCGVGILRFPEGSVLDKGCATHDFFYSSPAFQYFHSRQEADDWMRAAHKKATENSVMRIFVKPFYWIARLCGKPFWENKETR